MDTINLHLHLKNTHLRLREEYGWSDDFINAAINEYGKFLSLHHITKGQKFLLVPGKTVDKVWHDHILHTKNYIEFCDNYFGEYLHHTPLDRTTNAAKNDMKPTLDLYEKTFGYKAPEKYWIKDIKYKTQIKRNSDRIITIKPHEPCDGTKNYSTTSNCCR